MVVVSQDASNADTSALGLGEARERAERERGNAVHRWRVANETDHPEGHELDTFFEASLKTPELDSTPTSQQESFTDSADQESPALERARHRRIEEERQRREQAQDDIELLSGRAPSQASLSAAYFGSPTPRRGNQYLVFGEPPNSPQHNWSPISPVTQSSGSGGNRTSSVSAGPSRPRATYGGQMPGYQSAEDALARGLHDGSGTPF
ncbi:MAG: hypothetical protein M1820_004148 [Bogoriella megaspora]|nr:MAG: hypothetical protein M1820_004148 [Bogoriella megaspora]